MNKLIFNNPYIVLSLVFLITIFGFKSIDKLPVQLLPEIGEKRIVVGQVLPGATPEMMERQMVEPLEELLASIPGVLRFETDIAPESSWINITFNDDHDMDQAYLDVTDQLGQFNGAPANALEPIVINKSKNNRGSIAGIVMAPINSSIGVTREEYTNAFEKIVQPRINAIQGVLKLTPDSSVKRKIILDVEMERLAALGITPNDLSNIPNNSFEVSGRKINAGSKRFSIVFQGRKSFDEILSIPVKSRGHSVVYLKDIATIRHDFVEEGSPVYWSGKKSFYIGINATDNANIVEAIENIKTTINELNGNELARLGIKLHMTKDNSTTVEQAVSLVQESLLLGALAAIFSLFIFIRNAIPIIVIFASLPICILSSFVVLELFDRSFNIISLAGIALATGMILDAAIVVVETTLSKYKLTKNPLQSVSESIVEVRSALFSSVLSSIIVFLPIALMESAEGELFLDLALTISASLIASLIIALSFIPMLLVWNLKYNQKDLTLKNPAESLLKKHLSQVTKSRRLQTVFLIAGIILPISAVKFIAPHTDIIPRVEGAQVAIFVGINDRLSRETLETELVHPINEVLTEYQSRGEDSYLAKYLTYLSGSSGMVIAAYPNEVENVHRMKSELHSLLEARFPQHYISSQLNSLLGFGLSTSRRVTIDFVGTRLPDLQRSAIEAKAKLEESFEDYNLNIWSNTPLYNDDPQIILKPNIPYSLHTHQSMAEIARKIALLTDGLYLGEYSTNNRSIPMFIRDNSWKSTNELMRKPFYSDNENAYQPIGNFVKSEVGVAPSSLYRLNGARTLSLNFSPPNHIPLESFIQEMKETLNPLSLRLETEGIRLGYRGSADRLNVLVDEMAKQLLISISIMFLLVTATFNSLKKGVITLLALPITLFGGMFLLALKGVFSYQPLDVVTMMGFIILIGLSVNNSILFLQYYDHELSSGTNQSEALLKAGIKRSRPIYMSSLSSIFGMMPLAFIPGFGSEIYSGLALVIIGGMIFSAVLTPAILTSLLLFMSRLELRISKFNKTELSNI